MQNRVACLAAALMWATVCSPAAAQTNVQPAYSPTLALPAQTVATFLQNPQGLLQQAGDNSGRLAVQTRDLVASNPNALQPMLNLLKAAPPNQQAAIASGLAMATRIYARTNPNFAAQIQLGAVATGVPAALAVSVAATNTSTATMAIKAPPTPVPFATLLAIGASSPAGGITDAQGVGFNPGTPSGGINDQPGGQLTAKTGGTTPTPPTKDAPTGGFAQSVSPSQ
jgi:hypothetical protein